MDNLSQEVGLIIVSSFFLLLVAVGIITLVLVYQKRQANYVHEQARRQAIFEKELLEAQLAIQEQTLKHVAQDIHDNIGQTLTLARLNLNSIQPDKKESAAQKVADAQGLVAKAIADLRLLSKTLHADAVLSVGLARAVEMELNIIERTGLVQTHFGINGPQENLEPKKELIFFRTVQEALNNALKHSGANLLEVTLTYLPALLELTIKDNGHGFNVAETEKNPERGLGLRNMRSRIEMIGGTFTLSSSTKGTVVQLSLPIIAV